MTSRQQVRSLYPNAFCEENEGLFQVVSPRKHGYKILGVADTEAHAWDRAAQLWPEPEGAWKQENRP